MEFILEFKTATASQKVGDQIKISEDVAEIGRENGCRVQLDESCATVSRKHAKIEKDGDRYKIVALSQTNSTYVNGAPVKGERYLNNGDELKFSSQGPTVIFKVNDPRATVAVDPTSTRATQNVNTQRNAAPAAAATTPAAPAKKSNMPLILGIVAAAVIAIGAAIFLLGGKKEEPQQEVVEVKAPEIETIYKSIYYIKINDISVYGVNNALVTTLTTVDEMCGTGFMLSDGKFVTAKSVVQPWHVIDGVVGSDATRSWTYKELAAAGYTLVSNCTAYTSAGTSFKFSDTDCIPSQDGTDWVTLAKADQLATVGGLNCDAEWSLAPQYGVECQIAGYLPNSDIQKLEPNAYKNAVNVTELNKDNLIELSSQRWQRGLSGSPVVIDKDGQWTVIGIMTNSNQITRDVVVPIANAVK